MYALLRAGRFAAAFTLFALIASPSVAAETQRLAAMPVVAAPTSYTSGTTAHAAPGAAPVAAAPVPQVRQTWVFNSPSTTPAAPNAYAPAAQRPTVQQLVGSFVNYRNQDEQQLCLAKAVYFEARGETLEGQLAVAEVVLNRAGSGRYPATICKVVTQPWQFSFIRRGRFPRVDENCVAWHRALAIADIASRGLADTVASNVLWYHANYVSPSWGRRLTKVAQIGAHIFYS